MTIRELIEARVGGFMRAIVRLVLLCCCLACIETPCEREMLEPGYWVTDAGVDKNASDFR